MLRGLVRVAAQRHGVRSARGSGSRAGVPAHGVDLRSDTRIKPGPAVRRAMAEAVVGDDDYGEDPNVCGLQEKAAELLGVEQTLFVPTNTTANLISDLPHGTLDLDELQRMIARGLGNPYRPVCELICLENTHNSLRGWVLSMDYLRQNLGPGLQELASICSVDLSAVETNMEMVKVDGLPPEELCGHLQAASAGEVAPASHAVHVLLFPWKKRSVRAMWHRDISAQDTELVLKKREFVLRKLGP